MFYTIEDFKSFLDPKVWVWHNHHLELFNKAKGSSGNHQFWEGGYRDHLTQCFILGWKIYANLSEIYTLNFNVGSLFKVLYFHDVEKVFKYTNGLPEGWDKEKYLLVDLEATFGITFDEQERNALKYIHGEGDDYKKGERVMNELAGLCHAIDVISARTLHDKKGNQANWM
jgi:hypothetical protein